MITLKLSSLHLQGDGWKGLWKGEASCLKPGLVNACRPAHPSLLWGDVMPVGRGGNENLIAETFDPWLTTGGQSIRNRTHGWNLSPLFILLFKHPPVVGFYRLDKISRDSAA